MQNLLESIWEETPISNREVLREVKRGLIDFYSSSALANKEELVLNLIKQEGLLSRGDISIFGQNEKVDVRGAALIQGFQAHYHDMDDVHSDLRGHPSAVILPALLAVLQEEVEENVTIERFMNAYVIGIEIAAYLGEELNPDLYEIGYHTTSFLGGIAAVSAIAYLFNFTTEECIEMQAITMSQASGYRFQFGTDMKALQAGLAARQAVDSYYLYKAGIRGNKSIFQGMESFISNFKFDFNIARKPKTWKILDPGIWLKIYPFCSAAFRIADASLKFTGLQLSDIEKINLTFPYKRDAALLYTHPKNGREGQFSAEYVTLIGLEKGKFERIDFSEDKNLSPYSPYFDMIQRSYNESEDDNQFSEIKIRKKNGQILENKVYHPKGSPKNPLTDREVLNKFYSTNFPLEHTSEIINATKNIEEMNLKEYLTIIFKSER